MSHFNVLVVGKPIDKILAPYNENLKVAPYIDKMSWDLEKIFRKQQVTCFTRLFAGQNLDPFDTLTISLDKVNNEWYHEWNGGSLDEHGNGLSTDNPRSKWDWYGVGGRWTGEFILKTGRSGMLGSPGVFGNAPAYDADVTRVCDVDWKKMKHNAEVTAAKQWDNWINPGQEMIDWYKPEYLESEKAKYLRLYGTKTEFIQRHGYWSTYALVTKDEWISPGDMGWFGLSTDEVEDRERYKNRFVEIMKSLSPNTTLTIVDCHI